jgi:hypothetical protein
VREIVLLLRGLQRGNEYQQEEEIEKDEIFSSLGTK